MARRRTSNGTKTTALAERREKQAKALELRKAGATYDQIANTLGWANKSGAHKAVQAALDHIIAEPTDELRKVHYERLNHLLMAVWPRAQSGELPALDRAVGIMDRIARLYGIDAPTTTLSTESREVIVIDGSKAEYIDSLKTLRSSVRVSAVENFNGAEEVEGTPRRGSRKSQGVGENVDSQMPTEYVVDGEYVEESEE